jgi:hypothetical protein
MILRLIGNFVISNNNVLEGSEEVTIIPSRGKTFNFSNLELWLELRKLLSYITVSGVSNIIITTIVQRCIFRILVSYVTSQTAEEIWQIWQGISAI